MANITKGKVIEVVKHWSNGLSFDIKLRLAKDRRTGTYTYAVWFEEWGKGVDGPEPGDVVRRAKELIDDKTTITWDAFLFLRAAQRRNNGRDSECAVTGGVELSVSRCMVGTSASGRKVHMFIPLRQEFDKYALSRYGLHEGLPSTGSHPSPFRDGLETASLIPSTPENEAKALELRRGINEFGVKLVDFMSPEKVQESLGRVAVPALLEAPDEQ